MIHGIDALTDSLVEEAMSGRRRNHPVLGLIRELSAEIEDHITAHPDADSPEPYSHVDDYVQEHFSFFREGVAALGDYPLDAPDIIAISGTFLRPGVVLEKRLPLASRYAASQTICVGYGITGLEEEEWGNAIETLASHDAQRHQGLRPSLISVAGFLSRLKDVTEEIYAISAYVKGLPSDDMVVRPLLGEIVQNWRHAIAFPYSWAEGRMMAAQRSHGY